MPSAQIQKCRPMQIQLLECLLPVVGETICGKPDEHAIQRPLPSRVGRRKRYFGRIPFAVQRLTANRWLVVLPILVVCMLCDNLKTIFLVYLLRLKMILMPFTADKQELWSLQLVFLKFKGLVFSCSFSFQKSGISYALFCKFTQR